jgi:hypothetical protein
MSTNQDFKPWSMLRHVAENGEVTDIFPQYSKPLKYSDVVENHNDHHIEFVGESIIQKDSFKEKVSHTISSTINFRNPTSIYALVEGGWLPLPFVQPPNFLFDRNVISTLAKIVDGSIRQDVYHTNWWLSFLNNSAIIINPILYAWEGDSRKIPTYPEFCDHFYKGSKLISAVLPKANINKFQDEHFKAAYTTVLDLSKLQKKEVKFLLHAVPLIINRAPTSKLKQYWQNLANKARELRLNNRSLAVIVAYSCLFERQDGSGCLVGRRILKPRKGYTEQDAYNALSDLRALELFICSCGLEQKPMSLCTCDRAITAFWCLINPHSIMYENGKFTYSVTFSEDLFPRLHSEEIEILMAG